MVRAGCGVGRVQAGGTALNGLPTAWGVVEREWPSCLVSSVIGG
jgi:hypothetical protein